MQTPSRKEKPEREMNAREYLKQYFKESEWSLHDIALHYSLKLATELPSILEEYHNLKSQEEADRIASGKEQSK